MRAKKEKSVPDGKPDPELERLRQAWAPGWSIWRARRDDDPPRVRSGSFVATRMRKDAGRDPTLMQPTAVELDAELQAQRHLAGW